MRDIDGKFFEGHSGNPRGRPRKKKRLSNDTQLREDMLAAMEEELTVPIGGKRKKLPAILVIHKQLILKAANGDVRCMFKVIDLRRQIIAEVVEDRLRLLEQYLKNEKLVKRNPEDVTDKMLETMQAVRDMLREENML
jgi:hypothetical protein